MTGTLRICGLGSSRRKCPWHAYAHTRNSHISVGGKKIAIPMEQWREAERRTFIGKKFTKVLSIRWESKSMVNQILGSYPFMPTKLVNIRELGSISINTGRDVRLWVGTWKDGLVLQLWRVMWHHRANCICVHMCPAISYLMSIPRKTYQNL